MKKISFTLLTILISQNLYSLQIEKPLVSANWLYKNLANVKILDVRKQIHTFNTIGHIKGAILVDNKYVRVPRVINNKKLTRLIPSINDFSEFISNYSINTNDAIVITHEGINPGNVVAAARLYWHFKVYGYTNVALLDGGNKAWVNEALEELVKPTSNYKKGNFTVHNENKKILSSIVNVKKALQNKDIQVVDTRSLRFHIGIEKRSYVKEYGHIPKTKHFPFKFLTPLQNKTNFYSKEQLIKQFKNMNINPFKPIILYCNSGFEASSVWFALYEIIGNKNVSIYDASLHEWTMSRDNKMTTILGK